MKKVLLVLVVLSAAAFNSFGQSKDKDASGKFSIGLEAGLPVGSSSTYYSFIIGGSLKYELPLSEGLAFTGSAGYTSSMLKSAYKVAGQKSSYGDVPIKAGIKYYFDKAFYAEGQLGAVFSTESGGGTAFAYAPGVGYYFTSNLDLGIRYEGWSKDGTFSQVAARLAWNF